MHVIISVLKLYPKETYGEQLGEGDSLTTFFGSTPVTVYKEDDIVAMV